MHAFAGGPGNLVVYTHLLKLRVVHNTREREMYTYREEYCTLHDVTFVLYMAVMTLTSCTLPRAPYTP